MITPEDRVHACLDGELTRDALAPAEQQQLDAMAEAIAAATGSLRGIAAPDLTARVMSNLLAAEAPSTSPAISPASPAPVAEDGWARRAARWLWSPRAVAVRPAYGFAGVGMMALALMLASTARPVSEAPPTPVTLHPARAMAPTPDAADDDPHLYVQFRIEVPGASRVALAGSFTDWRPRYEMTEVSPGVWSAMVPLSPGVHDYTFVVDGKRMVVDPYAPRVSDSFGGSNSRLFLPAPNGSA